MEKPNNIRGGDKLRIATYYKNGKRTNGEWSPRTPENEKVKKAWVGGTKDYENVLERHMTKDEIQDLNR